MTQSRRDALRTLSALVAAPALVGLPSKGRVIRGGFADDDSAAGHSLRDGRTALPHNRPLLRTQVAIVGGGIGGLSAGWRLDALGMHDWTLLELAPLVGGNARSAEYPGLDGLRAPWGAHYLPVPGKNATHVRQLLRELGVLHPDGRWDERVLCHSPQERIWQHGRWHEGLDPLDAATATDREQFRRFEARVAEWRESGMFTVPSAQGHATRTAAARSRTAGSVDALDRLTAHDWMTREGFTSSALRWWVEYGTRDDYGASLQQASAWAAVHYFASRDAEEQGPLTWPEGNDWIVRELTRRLNRRSHASGRSRIVTNAPAVQITQQGTRWIVDTPAMRVVCDAVIWSAPLFVLPRVCPGVSLPVTLEYAPWVVANIVLDREPVSRGAPLAWDNVIYGSPALGYVNAQHQLLGTPRDAQLWTWYHAVVDRPARESRVWLQQRSWSAWRDEIIADLQRAHPDIADRVLRIDVRRWGHAMARPVPGILDRVRQLREWKPAPGLFVAHGDLSNLSLLEEAQWHGVAAAEAAGRAVGG